MTILTHLSALAERARRSVISSDQVYTVQLVDRRTRQPHCIQGMPLKIVTTEPAKAALDMLRNRDPQTWETTIERVNSTRVLQ